MSKILPGLLRDLDDWVAATRIKSAQLLYTLMLNNEENITQHMEKLLTALYRACHDEQKEVVQYVSYSILNINSKLPVCLYLMVACIVLLGFEMWEFDWLLRFPRGLVQDGVGSCA